MSTRPVGDGGGLAREAILAALRTQREASASVDAAARRVFEAGLTAQGPDARAAEAEPSGSPSRGLIDAVRGVDRELHRAESLPDRLVAGEVQDFHEVAAQLKRADLTFKFALEVRNKLVEAYREVMRMQV